MPYRRLRKAFIESGKKKNTKNRNYDFLNKVFHSVYLDSRATSSDACRNTLEAKLLLYWTDGTIRWPRIIPSLYKNGSATLIPPFDEGALTACYAPINERTIKN